MSCLRGRHPSSGTGGTGCSERRNRPSSVSGRRLESGRGSGTAASHRPHEPPPSRRARAEHPGRHPLKDSTPCRLNLLRSAHRGELLGSRSNGPRGGYLVCRTGFSGACVPALHAKGTKDPSNGRSRQTRQARSSPTWRKSATTHCASPGRMATTRASMPSLTCVHLSAIGTSMKARGQASRWGDNTTQSPP